MASHSYPKLGFGLPQELGSNEIINKSRVYVVSPGGRKHEILREISFNLKPQHLEPWKPFCYLSKSHHFLEFNSTTMKPTLMDVHGIAYKGIHLIGFSAKAVNLGNFCGFHGTSC